MVFSWLWNYFGIFLIAVVLFFPFAPVNAASTYTYDSVGCKFFNIVLIPFGFCKTDDVSSSEDTPNPTKIKVQTSSQDSFLDTPISDSTVTTTLQQSPPVTVGVNNVGSVITTSEVQAMIAAAVDKKDFVTTNNYYYTVDNSLVTTDAVAMREPSDWLARTAC